MQNSRAFRAIISLTVAADDGATQRIVVPTAGGEWSTAQSPNLFDDLYTGEVWDGRVAEALDRSGFWSAGAAAPAGLPTASVVKDNGGVNASAIMSAQLLPPIGVRQSYTPVSVTKAASFLSQGDVNCPGKASCVPPATPNATGRDATSGWIFKFNQSMVRTAGPPPPLQPGSAECGRAV